VEILLLVRHGQSVFNVDGIINGDPAVDRGLSPAGAGQAQQLEPQLAGIAIDLCVTSEFPRAKETARLALGDRAETTETIVDPDLNDIRIGTLEGQSLDAYHAWKRAHAPTASFPGGESLGDAARRYATAFERLLARREGTILCVCHEIPVRYAVNAARGSGELNGPLHDVPNATPYLFDGDGVRRAILGLRELAPG
jgi:ribonuclease H / adenosylcobalamin/alpha-ribazole phosphatase